MTYPKREELVERGIELARRFCIQNAVPVPTIQVLESDSDRRRARMPSGSCGLYTRGQIYVDVRACAWIGTGGPAWSYPGYVIDRTPFGVIQHELGHYVDDVVSERMTGILYSNEVRRGSREERLTNYAPNDQEWFAEMFRLFVTNPALLKKLRPRTWALLDQRWRPVERRSWSLVLKNAPARTQEQVLRKVEKAAPLHKGISYA